MALPWSRPRPRIGSQNYEFVERRCSMCCGHAARKRAALGSERTPQALNQEIEKSVAIGPSVDIDETGHGGAFYGTVDLGKAHLERSSQFRVCWSGLRCGKCQASPRRRHPLAVSTWIHYSFAFRETQNYVYTGQVFRAILWS